jgi:hypothetical protein
MKPANQQKNRCDSNRATDHAPVHQPTRRIRGAKLHSSSSRTLPSCADSGQAGAQQQSSSSGRKRRHDEYVEDNSDVILRKQTGSAPREGNAMPPPQQAFQQFKERPEQVGWRQAPQTPSHPYIGTDNIRSSVVTENQIYAESDWQLAQPPFVNHSRGLVFKMSGALTPEHLRDKQPLRQMSNRHSLGHSSKKPRAERLAISPRNISFLQGVKQGPDYANLVQNTRDSRYSQHTEDGVPIRTESRSSVLKRHLMRPQSRTGAQYCPRESGYLSTTESRQLFLAQPTSQPYYLVPTTSAPSYQHRTPSIAIPSPFFTRSGEVTDTVATPRQLHSSLTYPERLVGGVRHFHMQPAGSPMGQVGQSLNSLSFINSPYTKSNERVFNDGGGGAGRRLYVGRRRCSPMQLKAQPQYITHSDNITYGANINAQNRTQNQQFLRHISPSLHSQLGYALPPCRSFTGDDDSKLLSTIRGAKSGISVERNRTGKRDTALLHSTQIGKAGAVGSLISAGGRRSVRR